MYWCLYKRSLNFKWGELYKEVKPHLLKEFKTKQEAEDYLSKIPEHLHKHLQVTQGCNM